MLALFGDPLVIEPNLTLARQRLLWQIGYGTLVLLTAGCALGLRRSPFPDTDDYSNLLQVFSWKN